MTERTPRLASLLAAGGAALVCGAVGFVVSFAAFYGLWETLVAPAALEEANQRDNVLAARRLAPLVARGVEAGDLGEARDFALAAFPGTRIVGRDAAGRVVFDTHPASGDVAANWRALKGYLPIPAGAATLQLMRPPAPGLFASFLDALGARRREYGLQHVENQALRAFALVAAGFSALGGISWANGRRRLAASAAVLRRSEEACAALDERLAAERARRRAEAEARDPELRALRAEAEGIAARLDALGPELLAAERRDEAREAEYQELADRHVELLDAYEAALGRDGVRAETLVRLAAERDEAARRLTLARGERTKLESGRLLAGRKVRRRIAADLERALRVWLPETHWRERAQFEERFVRPPRAAMTLTMAVCAIDAALRRLHRERLPRRAEAERSFCAIVWDLVHAGALDRGLAEDVLTTWRNVRNPLVHRAETPDPDAEALAIEVADRVGAAPALKDARKRD